MTQVDYYEQYVELMAEKMERDREVVELKKKVEDQAKEILELQKVLAEKDELLKDLDHSKTTFTIQSAYSTSDQPVGHKSISAKPQTVDKTQKVKQLKSHGELIPWRIVFKKSHPGSLSHLRKQQRDAIQQAIKEFLIKNIGNVLEKECYNDEGMICIPESLIEPFHNWFDQKIDEGILDSTPKAVTPTAPRRQSHANNTLVERAPAKEVVKNFIPGNEFAQTLSDVAEKEYPDVVISLSKFMNLIESFCQDAMNRPLGVPVNKKAIRSKFEEVFREDIELYNNNGNAKKRKSDVGTRVVKKPKEMKSGLLKESPQPLELSVSKNDNIDQFRYNGLLRDVYPKYNTAPLDIRVTMKRKVKSWLKQQLGEQFSSCRMTIPSGENEKHQTYCVPKYLHAQFKEWASKELNDLGL